MWLTHDLDVSDCCPVRVSTIRSWIGSGPLRPLHNQAERQGKFFFTHLVPMPDVTPLLGWLGRLHVYGSSIPCRPPPSIRPSAWWQMTKARYKSVLSWKWGHCPRSMLDLLYKPIFKMGPAQRPSVEGLCEWGLSSKVGEVGFSWVWILALFAKASGVPSPEHMGPHRRTRLTCKLHSSNSTVQRERGGLGQLGPLETHHCHVCGALYLACPNWL